jgi:hypothetical protein
MASLNEIRKKYPQYNDMSDQDFADKFHDKFYSDIPKEEYYNKLGFSPKKQMESPKENNKSLLNKSAEFAQKYINEPTESLTRGANEAASGYLQGLANIGPGLYNLGAKIANLIPGVNVEEKKDFDFAPHNANAMIGELGSFFGPGMLGKIPEIANIPSHIANIPHMANALKKASEIIGKSPQSIQKAIKGLTSNTGKSIGGNALLGAVMSPEQQGLGAALGAGGAALGAGLGYGINKLYSKNSIPKKMLKGLDPNDKIAIERIEANKELKTTIRPSEAFDNPYVGKKEGKLAQSEKGAQETVNRSSERIKEQSNAISNLLENIHPTNEVSSEKIRKAAKSHIKNLEKDRDEIVQPFYEKSYEKKISPNKLKNITSNHPIVRDAVNKVLSDSLYANELKGYSTNSIKVLDLAQRLIKDKMDISGIKKNEWRLLNKSRNALLETTDSFSKNYKKARELYRDMSIPIDKIKDSQVGKISNLSDRNLKNVSKNIFDPNQTDISVLRDLRDRIGSQDIKAWNGIVRNEIERLKGKEKNGYGFYKKVLENDNIFKQLTESMSHSPKVVEKLNNMKKGWDTLIGKETVRSAIGSAEKNTSSIRETAQWIINQIKDIMGDKRSIDKINYINSSQWTEDLKKLSNYKVKEEKSNKLSEILGKVFPSGFNIDLEEK